MAKKITDSNFNKIVESENLIMLDFWAEWCGPCKAIGPIIEELSEELEDIMTVGKVNVDENPELSEMFEIRTIPTILILEDGEVIGQHVGSASKDELIEFIGSVIGEIEIEEDEDDDEYDDEYDDEEDEEDEEDDDE